MYIPTLVDIQQAFTFGLGIWTIERASERLLRRRIAQSMLPHPKHQLEFTPSQSLDPTPPTPSRASVEGLLRTAEIPLGVIAVVGFVAFLINQTVKHGFGVGFCAVIVALAMAVNLNEYMDVILPMAYSLSYQRVPTSKQTRWRFETLPLQPVRFVARFAVAMLCSLALLVAAGHGYTSFTGIFISAHAYSQLMGAQTPVIRTKYMVAFINGLVVFLMAIVGVFIILIQIFPGDSNEPRPNPADNSGILSNIWIALMMDVYSQSIGVTLPALLISHSLRFDFSLSGQQPIPTSDSFLPVAPDQLPRVRIPVEVTSAYPRPHFLAGMVGYGVSVTVSYFVAPLLPAVRTDRIVAGYLAFLLNPFIVSLSIALVAWTNNSFTQWWAYTEIWQPSDEDEEAVTALVLNANESAGEQDDNTK